MTEEIQVASSTQAVSERPKTNAVSEGSLSFASLFERLLGGISSEVPLIELSSSVEPREQEVVREESEEEVMDYTAGQEEQQAVNTQTKDEDVEVSSEAKSKEEVPKEVVKTENTIGRESDVKTSREEVVREESSELSPEAVTKEAWKGFTSEGQSNLLKDKGSERTRGEVTFSDYQEAVDAKSAVKQSIVKEDRGQLVLEPKKLQEAGSAVTDVLDVGGNEGELASKMLGGEAVKSKGLGVETVRQLFDKQQLLTPLQFEKGSQAGMQFSADGGSKQTGVLFANNESSRVQGKARGGSKLADLARASQDKIIAKIQEMFDSAVKGRFGTSMVVRLDPPELGKLTLKVTQRSDQLFARVIPESQEVEAVLRNKVSELSTLLAQSGFKAENVHVSIGDEVLDTTGSQFGDFFSENFPNGEANQGSNEGFHGFEPSNSQLTDERSVVGGWIA